MTTLKNTLEPREKGEYQLRHWVESGRVSVLWGMIEVRDRDLSKSMCRTETYFCPLRAKD